MLVDPDVAAAIDALPNHTNSYGYDAWGFNPNVAKRGYTFGKRIVFPYFRPEAFGLNNIPNGRVLIVGNHSGQLPFDGMIVALVCLLAAKQPRLVRAMVERWFPDVPYVSDLLWRCGAVLGDPINCRNLLLDDQSILVFPEGVRGSGKTWSHRYKLAPFGRGFMRLALQTDTPIVPCAIIGGEESIPSLFNVDFLARLLGVPYLPVPPHLPVAGLLAYLPLPVRFRIYFGKPIYESGRHDDEDAVIDERVSRVTSTIQDMIDDGLKNRRSIFR